MTFLNCIDNRDHHGHRPADGEEDAAFSPADPADEAVADQGDRPEADPSEQRPQAGGYLEQEDAEAAGDEEKAGKKHDAD